MNYKRNSLVTLVTVFAMIVNLLGRYLATAFQLPMWLDSSGTILIAYIYGPVCGGIVGLVNNIIYGIFVDQQSIYCFVGMVIGILSGVLSKKGAFETPFHVMTLGAQLSILCTILSSTINILFFGGVVGNVWADQIILMCVNNDIPKLIAFFISQFYIEFLDKLVSVYGVFLIIKLARWISRKKRKQAQQVASILGVIILASCLGATSTYATEPTDTVTAPATEKKLVEEDYDAYTHTTYGSDEGLLAGEANDIAQTKEGQLWIGTYSGLYSYNGVNFTLYNDIDSVKNVNDLYVDEEGRLWVGTNDNGVTMMINGHVMNVVDTDSGLLSNSVRSIICDSNGYYYIGSTAGISIVTLSGGVKVLRSFPDVKNVINFCANSSGQVIAVTDSGEIQCFQNGEPTDIHFEELEDHVITTVFFDRNEQLYFGTDTNSIMIYRDGTGNYMEKEIVCSELDRINSLYESDDDEIFICSDNGVGYLTSSQKYKLINTERFTSSIDNMMIDYQGNLWFASSRQGLIKLCKSSFTNLFAEVGEVSHVVNAVANFKGNLYCGTDDGLVILNEKTKKTTSNELTELLEGVRIRNINIDSTDNLWISTTGNGLYKVTATGNTFDIQNFNENNGMPGKRVRCCIELSSGDMVASGDEGVAFIKDDKVIKTITAEDGLVNIKSLCVIEYKDRIYVGSDGGGITVLKDQKIERRITKEDGLCSDVVMRMVYDPKSDGLFIVTSNGLCYMDSQGILTYLDNFPYSNNFDIITEKNGSLWVLSSAGIYIANSKQLIENQEKDYELLNSKRGLRSSLTANSYSFKYKDSLYLCCDSDVVKVNLTDYNLSAKYYRMSMNSVNVDGFDYEISRSKPLTINADAKVITFTPRILNYSLNDPYISYRLEGVDSEDKVVLLSELSSITYSNLRPGNYTFKISVLDASRQKVIESGRYEIIKDMEMYQSWWFKLYFVIVAAVIIIWITWFITRSRVGKTVLKQKLELEYAKKQLKMGNETILSIARTVDAKDSNTSQHSFRVSEYSVAIARRYGFNEDKCENIRQMALLHDIGKIGIPDVILNKPAKLDDDEYAIMKSHVVRGGEILKDFTLIENVNVGAMYHHERYDGKGYCSGLKGEEIPIEARIIGIADAFDAMTANRVYRKQLDIDYVISELKRCRGTQFDPNLTDIMLTLIDEGVIDVETLYKESKEETL